MEITHQHHTNHHFLALGLILVLVIFGITAAQQPQAPASQPTQNSVQHFYTQHQGFSNLLLLNHGHSLD